MNEFALIIEEIKSTTGLNYIDSIMLWCERNNYEVESAAELVRRDTFLKNQLKVEAEALHMISGSSGNVLPIR